MDIRTLLGKNLKQMREMWGYTQAYVAETCGFEVPSYSRWENGKSWPNPETINKLSILFHCSPSYFYREENDSLSNLTQKDIDSIAEKASSAALINTLQERLKALPDGFLDHVYYFKPSKEAWAEVNDVIAKHQFKEWEANKPPPEESAALRKEVREKRLEDLRKLKEK